MSARFELIDAEKATVTAAGAVKYSVVKMCEWLEVSSSGYYDWRDRSTSAAAARRDRLKVLIGKVFTESDGTYGYRRVQAQLVRWGEPAGPELVRALMRELGLVACQPRPWRHSLTVADAAPAPIPDLVRRDFTAPAPGQKLVGDITYIPTWEGWVYLATVLDCHTKAVIGWATGDNYKTPLISAAIRMAARNQGIVPGAIFHSDRGSNRGFNWSSHHPDDGGVPRWQDVGSRLLIGRSGRRCGHRVGRRLGGRSSGSFGSRSLRVSRVRTRRLRSACRDRSGRAGFATVAGCHRSVSPSRRAGTCRSPNARRSRF